MPKKDLPLMRQTASRRRSQHIMRVSTALQHFKKSGRRLNATSLCFFCRIGGSARTIALKPLNHAVGLSAEIGGQRLLKFLKFLVKRQEGFCVTHNTPCRLMGANQITAHAAGHANAAGINTPFFDNFIGEIWIGKGHTAKQHAIAQALFNSARRKQVGILPQVCWCRSQHGHFRHGSFNNADAVNHAIQKSGAWQAI